MANFAGKMLPCFWLVHVKSQFHDIGASEEFIYEFP